LSERKAPSHQLSVINFSWPARAGVVKKKTRCDSCTQIQSIDLHLKFELLEVCIKPIIILYWQMPCNQYLNIEDLYMHHTMIVLTFAHKLTMILVTCKGLSRQNNMLANMLYLIKILVHSEITIPLCLIYDSTADTHIDGNKFTTI
jgi:hypothetical protein